MGEPASEQQEIHTENVRLHERIKKAVGVYQKQKKKIEALEQRIESLTKKLGVAERDIRDKLLEAAITGLCSWWSWENTSSERLALQAEKMVDAVLRLREKRKGAISPLDHMTPTKKDKLPTGEAPKPEEKK